MIFIETMDSQVINFNNMNALKLIDNTIVLDNGNGTTYLVCDDYVKKAFNVELMSVYRYLKDKIQEFVNSDRSRIYFDIYDLIREINQK